MGSLAFLSPLFLYGALGATVPLLLHLIRRERAKPRVFSTIRFLKMSSRQMVRQQKLRRLLLLLLRMACCALLAVIFARPFLKDAANAALMGPQPKAMALVIDTSYSMGFGSRLDRAKRQAREILRDLHPGDQVALITFSTQGYIVKALGSDFVDLPGLLEHRVTLTNQATNYIEALRMADDQLSRSGFSDRTVYLISDFQETGWDRQASRWKLSPGIRLKSFDLWDDRDANVAVTDIDIPGELTKSNRSMDIAVRLKNFGLTPFQGRVQLTINGRPAGTKTVSLPSQSGQVVSFRHTFDRDHNAGMVTFGDDPLPVDNTLYFTLDMPPPLRVLIVEERATTQGDRTSAAYYLDQALGLRTDPPMTVEVTTADRLRGMALGSYQTVILADLTTLDRSAQTRLNAYVRAGGGLLVGLGTRVSPNVFNTAFGSLLPGRLTDVRPEQYNRDAFRSISEVDYPHPVFQPFAGPHHGDFGTARFFQTGRAEPDSTAAVLAKFENADPALIEKTLGQGRILLFLSTFNSAWNDLPVRGVYLPFLYQMVDYLSGQLAGHDKRNRRYHLIGETVRLTGASSPLIAKPSGAQITMDSTPGDIALFTETDEPGLYAVGPGGSGGHFAVNLDTRESDLTHLDLEELVAAVINPVTESKEAQEMKAQASLAQNTEIERRQRLWWYLSVFLLAVILGETFLASRTHR